jgi:hypothetical protein
LVVGDFHLEVRQNNSAGIKWPHTKVLNLVNGTWFSARQDAFDSLNGNWDEIFENLTRMDGVQAKHSFVAKLLD